MNQPRHLAASVRQRLLNLAQAQREDFKLVLTRYGILFTERLRQRTSVIPIRTICCWRAIYSQRAKLAQRANL
jgi:hypothetical protein